MAWNVVITHNCHAEPVSLAPPARAGVRSISLASARLFVASPSKMAPALLRVTIRFMGNHQPGICDARRCNGFETPSAYTMTAHFIQGDKPWTSI